MDEPVYVVFNPHSGKGRGARFVAPVLQALAPARRLEHGLTQGPGDEGRLAEEAIRRGFRRIVAVGGDGTWSNVGNAILRTGLPVALGLVPGGTGCDLAKTLGIPPRDLGACCRIVLDGKTRAIDVGRIEDKHFLNIAGFGYDVAVLEDSWSVGYLEGGALYLYCALRQLGSYRGFSLETEADGRPLGRSDMLMVIVANARIFGGGFRVAPHADVEDGKLDAIAVGNMGLAGRVNALVRLLRGTHLRHPRVAGVTASRLVYRFEAPPAYETDGEWNQARSAEVVVEAVPRALRVLVPAR
ncbi:MAG TPA: diacylglycerol kinase family protein [Vicinamibacteria bacterium]|nr:diacylglycerol kinase family protein [Vicinamibacteria bacterium]